MASARKPPPGRGRAALLIGGALSAGLLLAACEKLSDLGVNLDMEETAKAPIGSPLYLLSDMPTVAPAEGDDEAADATAGEPASAAGDEPAPATAVAQTEPAAVDTHGLTLRPQPLSVSLMMAAARPVETAVASVADVPAQDPAADEPAAIATVPTDEMTLPSEVLPTPESEPLVVTAPAIEAESEPESIATLLADLFAPLLEPAAGPAMASVPDAAPAEAATEIVSLGMVEVPEPAAAAEAAALEMPGVEMTGVEIPAGAAATGSDGDLTGLTEAEVEQLLGPPLAVRRDDPAESWQYATNDCVLDLFFYEQTGAWRVVHMEARTIAALDAPADNCVKSVLAGRFPSSRTS